MPDIPISDICYACRPATEAETLTTVEHLKNHTERAIGMKVQHEPFAVTAYENGALIGSVIGKVFSGWLHLDLVWVADIHRGKGIGRTLIEHTLAQARKRHLSGIEVWTQSWQSPAFYVKTGFTEFATLDDFIPGKKRHAFRYRVEATL